MSRAHMRAVIAALLISCVALAGGAAAALAGARYAAGDAEILLANAGRATETLLPVSAALAAAAGALTLGGSILAGWLLDPSPEPAAWTVRARERAMTIAFASAIAWTLLLIVQFILAYSLSSGQPLFSAHFGSDIGVFAASDLGVWSITAIAATALASAVGVSGTGTRTARATTFTALGAVVAKGMTGHAAGSVSHESATSSMFFHLLAFSVWVGPLLVLQFLPALHDDDEPEMRRAVERFSSLALLAWIGLALSGVLALLARLSALSELLTHPYGQLGLAKAALLLVLGVCGYVQRRVLARRTSLVRSGFRELALLEILLMGAAIGLAAAMSSSPPPAQNIPPPATPAGILTTYALPPDPRSFASLTQVRPDIFAIGASILALTWLLTRRVARGVDHQNRRWIVLALVLYPLLASSALAVYSRVLFSAHLALSLALLVLPGSALGMGVSETFLDGVRRVLGRRRAFAYAIALVPAFALACAYLVPAIMRRLLESHPANLGLDLAMMACGALLVVLMRAGKKGAFALGTFALVVVLAWMAFTPYAIAPSWFGAMGRTWFADTLRDQHVGAGLAAVIVAIYGAAVWGATLTSRKSRARSQGARGDARDR
ncbi:copper resistance D family protein [Dermabacter vaginalis]|uniref:copper resistance D family protein n=1 Tax=Dermabacter vaginalis TaxID=1630135 RepID=UPI0009F6E45D|nr:CopD family protein [Dermabacter vaginalis]